MKKLLLAVVILGLATATIPELRLRAEPYALAAWEWTRENVWKTRFFEPLRRLETEDTMSRMANALIRERNMGALAPMDEEAFQSFVARRELDALDSWGSLLELTQVNDSLEIRSAGPDRVFQTEDDLRRAISYKRQQDDPFGGRR